MPSAWRTAPSPTLAQDVDSTIYELHIRDYSMSDAKVPAAKRGSYLAFAENGDGRAHLKALAKAGPQHRAPAAELRHRLDRGGPGQAADAAVRPRVVRPRQRASSRSASAPSRARTPSTGATTPTTTACPTARTRRAPRRLTAAPAWPSSARWSGPCTRTACASCSTRSSTTRPQSGQADKSVLDKVVPGYYHRLNATRRRRDLDVLPERRHRARHGREAHGRLRRARGPGTTRSTASASTSWATTARPTCWPCARPSTP